MKALIYLGRENADDAFSQIEKIFKHLERKSYAIEAWLLMRKLFLLDKSQDLFERIRDMYIKDGITYKGFFGDLRVSDTTSKNDYTDFLLTKIKGLLASFYMVSLDNVNDFTEYDSLLYYFIVT